ncbi:conjugal transfer protein TraO [Aquimarina sp. MAR_2010_214]|uniref:conjugal transfer protein TraO n=1 Tax=Aquimarina sp. MAR_2010_214 TaxID=1250026 RepID=UPI0013044CB6|nr:conjugal transfer protein TraO [Aquimarina sp. MAR_2010_214]
MKQQHIILLIMLLAFCTVSGQYSNEVSGLIGYSNNGYSAAGNFHYYPDKNIGRYFEIGGYAGFLEEKQTGYDIPIEVYTLNVGYFTNIPLISNYSKSFLFSVGVGGVIGNESIDFSEIQLQEREFITTKGGAIYGGYGAAEADVKITNHLSAIARYTHFYHPESEIGKNKFMIGLGLAFKF